jgi:hypothetical protein
VEPL